MEVSDKFIKCIFMVNKTSPGGRGGGSKKFKKGFNIFSKKGFLRGGTMLQRGCGAPKKNFRAYARKLCPAPKQKPSYAPGIC